MKKLLIATCLLISAGAMKAQQTSPQQAIKLNPLSLFLLTGNVSYERAVNQNQSVQLGAYYSGVSIGGLKYSGFGFTPEYRFYIGGKREALNGVYAAPFLRYQSFSLKDKATADEAKFNSFGGGATLGWEKTWGSGFVLDLFVGPSYNKGRFKNEADEDAFDISSGISGFGVRTGIAIGFAL